MIFFLQAKVNFFFRKQISPCSCVTLNYGCNSDQYRNSDNNVSNLILLLAYMLYFYIYLHDNCIFDINSENGLTYIFHVIHQFQAMDYLIGCREQGGQSSAGEFYRFLSEFQKASR